MYPAHSSVAIAIPERRLRLELSRPPIILILYQYASAVGFAFQTLRQGSEADRLRYGGDPLVQGQHLAQTTRKVQVNALGDAHGAGHYSEPPNRRWVSFLENVNLV